MNTPRIQGLRSAIRFSAICGSAIAAFAFALAFAGERHLSYQIERFLAGKEEGPGLVVYLGLICLVFACYLLASKSRLAQPAGILAIAAVAAVFAWCQLHLGFLPSPYLMAMALPALFHIVAVGILRPARGREPVPAQNETAGFATAPEAA